ncbi:hypothetical protein N7468_000028 [Penicillium chermesinum]|uniref:Alcohol dehydrogenase-like N-terminal domain-containing protein n=1 Tax=Penicillium chermesinum TaxID=63820 RepID=A0A9W9PJJ7_9EURO|nr:uncharacterized protein N7468_000028 [Penicillium chermesinum]KAJ5248577.1 hypothetical protein N7468_000028 [Penicillium chermesinum]
MSVVITTDVSNYEAKGYGDPNKKMKALTWQGKNQVKVVETACPTIVDDGDVILKVTGSTICGSDLHLLHAAIPNLEKGDILGHEFCGVVESVGPAVKNITVGERAVASFQIACGKCYYCQKKLSSMCERTNKSEDALQLYGRRTAGIFGYSHFTGGFAGGQAEYVRVPYGDVNLLPLPDDVPDEKGLYLSDVLSTSWNAVADKGVEKGDTVAIWGAGPIGQMAAEFSFVNGAKTTTQARDNRVYESPKGETVTSTLKKMCDGRGPDVAIECAAGEYTKGWAHYFERMLGMETDTSELINEMITSVRGFGRCGITGVYAGFCNHFNIGSMMETGVRLIGNGQAPVHKYWKELLQYIKEDKIHPLDMVTHRYKLEDMEKVYELFNKRDPGMQKVFVQTKFSAPPAPGAPALTEL